MKEENKRCTILNLACLRMWIIKKSVMMTAIVSYQWIWYPYKATFRSVVSICWYPSREPRQHILWFCHHHRLSVCSTSAWQSPDRHLQPRDFQVCQEHLPYIKKFIKASKIYINKQTNHSNELPFIMLLNIYVNFFYPLHVNSKEINHWSENASVLQVPNTEEK